MINMFTNQPRTIKDDQRRRMFEENMAILADAVGLDVVQRNWEKDWHEFNVNLDIAETHKKGTAA